MGITIMQFNGKYAVKGFGLFWECDSIEEAKALIDRAWKQAKRNLTDERKVQYY